MVQPPTYLDRITAKIKQKQKSHHRYIVVSSGTAYQVNRSVLQNVPMKERSEQLRHLVFEWSAGRQSLNGLKGIIRDQSLIYKEGTVESILALAQTEVEIGCRYLIVPEEIIQSLSEKVGLTLIGYEKCLFLD